MTNIITAFRVVSGACALAATLPGTIELLLVTLGAARRTKRPAAAAHKNFRLAVVIPAHNEAALIARTVASVLASAEAAGTCGVLVVADNCTDNTAAIAADSGARVLVRENHALRGKGYALRLAFDSLMAEGFDGFLVIDADSTVTPNLVSQVKRRLAAGSAALQCRYRISNSQASVRARLMDLAFLAFNVMRPKGRAGWGLSAGILGNGFALSSATLRRAPWDAASIVEDLEYHLRLVAAGERVDFIDDATVFGETPSSGEEARVQRSRWEGGRLRMVKEWTPRLTADVLRGKWRFAEPLFELLLLPLAWHVLLLLFAAIALTGSLRAGALSCLGLVLIHVLGACLLGGKPMKTVIALAAAPFYIVWKITTLRTIVSASRRDAGWVRTAR